MRLFLAMWFGFTMLVAGVLYFLETGVKLYESFACARQHNVHQCERIVTYVPKEVAE